MLAPDEAEGAPMKKDACGIVAHISGGEEQLCVFGGHGKLNSSLQQPTAHYHESIKNPGSGWTNEFHCFTSGRHIQYIVNIG